MECRLNVGGHIELLDVVDVSLIAPKPHSCQVENHVIDSTVVWTKRGTLSPAHLPALCDNTGALWANGQHSSNGLNDKIPEDVAGTLCSSLCMVRPENLIVVVQPEYENRLKVRGKFHHEGAEYWLAITDPRLEAHYLSHGVGEYPTSQEVVLCISITEPIYDFRYKVIAAVIVVEAPT